MKTVAPINAHHTQVNIPWAVCNKCGSTQPEDHMMLIDAAANYHQCEDCIIALAHDLCWGTKLELLGKHPEHLAPTPGSTTIYMIREQYHEE